MKKKNKELINYSRTKSTEFAPIEVVITVQLVFMVTGVYLAFKNGFPILISFPNSKQLGVSLLVGSLIFLVSFTLNSLNLKWRDVLRWAYWDNLNIGPLWAYLFFPLLTSLGEESIFRVFLQSKYGLWVSTFWFLLYHLRINSKTFYILFSAFIMNLIFGYSYIVTQNLIVPLMIHFQFHFYNMLLARILIKKRE